MFLCVCTGHLFVLIDLRGEVVPKVTHVADRVLNSEWDFLGKAKGDLLRHRGGLGEEVKVAKSEGERHWLLELDESLLLLLTGGVLADSDVTGTHVAGDREFDSLLVGGDSG